MENGVCGPSQQTPEIAHESAGVGLDEVALQRVIVRPFLNEYVALGLLEVGIDAVAAAAVLLARTAAHLGRDLDEALAMLIWHLDTTGHEDHRAHAIRCAWGSLTGWSEPVRPLRSG